MNTFEDDNSLPYPFDPASLGFAPSYVSAIPVDKFPSVTTTGYQGTGFTGVNNRKSHAPCSSISPASLRPVNSAT